MKESLPNPTGSVVLQAPASPAPAIAQPPAVGHNPRDQVRRENLKEEPRLIRRNNHVRHPGSGQYTKGDRKA